MTFDERWSAVSDGMKLFGWDFFMVDSRTNVMVHASPFHIQEERDRATFAQFASPFIPWVAHHNAELSARTRLSAEKLYDAIVSGNVGMVS
jgi:hypothetical protein